MCNGSLDSNCGAFAVVNGCHCQKPLYSNFNLLTQKKTPNLPFGKGKKGFGKTVVLLLQLVMNWNGNQIILSHTSVGQIPLPTMKWKKCGKLSICPPEIDSLCYRKKLVHVLLKVVTSEKVLEVAELWINIFKEFGSVLACCYLKNCLNLF